MKRPAFQFYPGDWQGNAKLRRCTKAERGIWLDVLCLMHDSETEYGVLRWPLAEVAEAAGAKVADLRSLRSKGVLKGADVEEQCTPYVYVPRHAARDGTPVILVPIQAGPIWYSSRMVRDEYVRTRAGASTRFGSPSREPSQRGGAAPSQRQGELPAQRDGAQPSRQDGHGASSSSSSSASTTKSKASTAEKRGGEADPEKQEIWSKGKDLLGESGAPFLGKLIKDYGQKLVLQALRDCENVAPISPKDWLVARCQERRGNGGQHQNKQEALEERNRRVAENWEPPPDPVEAQR